MLCSEPDLQCGFSRDLFVAWCGNPKNSIILTVRSTPGTLARWLIDHPENKTVTMEVGTILDNDLLHNPDSEVNPGDTGTMAHRSPRKKKLLPWR